MKKSAIILAISIFVTSIVVAQTEPPKPPVVKPPVSNTPPPPPAPPIPPVPPVPPIPPVPPVPPVPPSTPDSEDHDININIGDAVPGDKKCASKSIRTRWIMLDMGINTYTYDGSLNLPTSLDNFEQNYGRSLDWQLHIYQQRINLYKKKVFISHSLGVDFALYNFNSNNVLKADQSTVQFTPLTELPDYTAGQTLKNNRLFISSANIPIMLHFENMRGYSARAFHAAVGVYGGLVLGSNVRYTLSESGKEKVRDDYNLNKFRVGLRGQIGLGPINLFTTYSLTPMFKTGTGPELHPLTFGITLIPF